MFRSQTKVRSRPLVRIVLIAIAPLLFSISISAQSSRPISVAPQDPPPPNSGKADPSDINFGSPENEMRDKLLLKEEKKQYDENVARAHEVSELGSQLHESFAAKGAFSLDDTKKLERLEKLTRKIRSEAGGSDSEAESKDMPAETSAVLKHLADAATELFKLVEKTPRHVVSAAVIDQSNKLIGLIQRLRNTRR